MNIYFFNTTLELIMFRLLLFADSQLRTVTSRRVSCASSARLRSRACGRPTSRAWHWAEAPEREKPSTELPATTITQPLKVAKAAAAWRKSSTRGKKRWKWWKRSTAGPPLKMWRAPDPTTCSSVTEPSQPSSSA